MEGREFDCLEERGEGREGVFVCLDAVWMEYGFEITGSGVYGTGFVWDGMGADMIWFVDGVLEVRDGKEP